MQRKLQFYVISFVIALLFMPNAQAGLILFDDRDAFELAVSGSLTTERFDDGVESDDFVISRGNRGLMSTSSLNSDDDSKAVTARERATLEINFNYNVFAFGFDINQLNINNLSYFDSAGHEVIDGLLATPDEWDASNFFGVVSDTAITSFSLVGSGSSSNLYGFDDFIYDTNPVSVNEPITIYLFILSLIAIAIVRQRKYTN